MSVIVVLHFGEMARRLHVANSPSEIGLRSRLQLSDWVRRRLPIPRGLEESRDEPGLLVADPPDAAVGFDVSDDGQIVVLRMQHVEIEARLSFLEVQVFSVDERKSRLVAGGVDDEIDFFLRAVLEANARF